MTASVGFDIAALLSIKFTFVFKDDYMSSELKNSLPIPSEKGRVCKRTLLQAFTKDTIDIVPQ